MAQQEEPWNHQHMPPFACHFGLSDTPQYFFCCPPPPPYLNPFFHYYDDQRWGPAYRYQSPTSVPGSAGFQPPDGPSPCSAKEESDEDSVLDLLTSEFPDLCIKDQFVVSACMEGRGWGEIQRDYQTQFGVSCSSTRPALAMRLYRLKRKYPKLRSILGDKRRKKQRRRDEEAEWTQRSSRQDAIAAAYTLLDFVSQPPRTRMPC
ncbi:hypothetical protein CSUB01_10255 [Colletotrichum sublineola]|uniref:Uncharacterized protein n=1 Tax=Colletotrichum sublineola TaxID=1173701 RepID=A0A066Y1A4_COLSU|nr:hypothetical protein CSUB01_10255 [Colletotrichum sublineola]